MSSMATAVPAPVLDLGPSRMIWDEITLDLLLKVSRMTVLNPLFSMWVPLLTLSQRYPTSSWPFLFSSLYFLTTLFLSLLSFASTLYINKPWRLPSFRSSPVTGLFGGPVLEWEKQIVVVTGGAGGVGRCLVETLAVRGVEVVIIDRVAVEGVGDDVHSYVCDLADTDAIATTARKISQEVGHPTILVNNAGVVQGKLLLDLSAEEVRQTFNVNVVAQFATIKAFLPHMIKMREGHIVTVASVFGRQGVAQLSDYCASKHALLGMHESLSSELKYRYSDPPIRLSLVLPSRLSTPLFASLRPPSRLINFLAPIVEPHEVVKQIIAALETCQSREICLPAFVGFVGGMRALLPLWAWDLAVWISGANEAMETFVKAERKAD